MPLLTDEPTGDVALRMEHIRKAFPGVLALDDVSLEVRQGEVHVLLGENGAGKSTLMKILGGAHHRDAGRIFIEGREVELENPRQARAAGVAIIYQELTLIPALSAPENIFLGREPHRLAGLIDRRRMRRDAAALLDSLGATIDLDTPAGRLSVAQQQLIEVAKALSLEARILVMDEPTSALTEREIRALFAAIARLKSRGVAIVYISHRLDEIFEIGDRVTVLRDGRWIATTPVANASRRELVRLMANRELDERTPKTPVARGEELLRLDGAGRRGVLRDISFTLHRGEILGIAGLLGSGRTSLARAIFGREPLDEGRLLVRGRPVRIRSPRQAIGAGLGFLTEDRKVEGLVLGLSVRENIGLPLLDRTSRFGLVDRRAEREMAERYTRDLRIKTPSIEQRVAFLSGGNQQKVVMSKWLAARADILILDEPTRGIDVGAKQEIYALMGALVAEGMGILLISSELPEIVGLSDRVLVMRGGRICGEFPGGAVSQDELLSCALGA
jgi:ribose transport system ATP-binding protein